MVFVLWSSPNHTSIEKSNRITPIRWQSLKWHRPFRDIVLLVKPIFPSLNRQQVSATMPMSKALFDFINHMQHWVQNSTTLINHNSVVRRMQECFKKTTNMYSFHNYWKQIDLQCEYAPEEIPPLKIYNTSWFENIYFWLNGVIPVSRHVKNHPNTTHVLHLCGIA